ncbi:3-ketoacyl-(acyl-carrier-protein) reductase (plasmid) [Streptomyces sp. YIM 121038]|uniref:hypothetical protein n=1 Tax=Streptomyces sp. YIM 121038 TaxID=2136401 RepID=UPI001110433D|nr:hypothetical protein [Streptomyces sp. YIM 121038]QCX82857.1 3-ketoacyl-(acyl-carrier-protein) reductase [Streptomyces sp. YIM 121038]
MAETLLAGAGKVALITGVASGIGVAVATIFVVHGAARQGAVTEEHAAVSGPIGQFAVPEEVAEPAAWIRSGKAPFIVGIAMAVGGGWTTR